MEIRHILLIFSMFLSGVFIFIASILTLIRRLKTKNSLLNYPVLSFFLWSINWIFLAIGHATYQDIYNRIGFMLQIPSTLLLLIFIEYISEPHIRPIRMAIFIFISTMYAYYISLPEISVIEIGYGLHFTGNLKIFQLLFGLFYNLIMFEWAFKIYSNCPPQHKNLSRKLLIAGFTANILPIVFYSLSFIWTNIRFLPFIFYASGMLYIIFILFSEPKLVYLLTFKADRLIIFSRKSGMHVYECNWTDKAFGNNLLSAIMYSVLSVSNSVLMSGDLDQMSMQDSAVIFDHKEIYTIALFSNKISNYLNHSLLNFSMDFDKEIQKLDINEKKGINSNDFLFVDGLIEKHFQAIPKWI